MAGINDYGSAHVNITAVTAVSKCIPHHTSGRSDGDLWWRPGEFTRPVVFWDTLFIFKAERRQSIFLPPALDWVGAESFGAVVGVGSRAGGREAQQNRGSVVVVVMFAAVIALRYFARQ